ncbi:MAG: DUF2442 domain-containing protein [Chitinophagaceae bacterium]|nr:DUF2442 domain-containing protein [Chitinophagaceae bacterium]
MIAPKILKVKAIKKFALEVEFADGVKGDYDLGHLAGKGVFQSWEEGDIFFNVGVDAESGSIVWPGGSDIDPLHVYCRIKGIPVDEYLDSLSHYAPN